MNSPSSGDSPEIVITADGSHTLLMRGLGEPYHSLYGALQETRYVYLESGFLPVASEKKHITVLEIGFGTGLNALATWDVAKQTGTIVKYIACEPFPVSEDVYNTLNHPSLFKNPESREVYLAMHKAFENDSFITISDTFHFQAIRKGIMELCLDTDKVDCVYFDAFAPEIVPKLWETSVFSLIGQWMAEGGIWVSYCAKGQVRRNLKEAGFFIRKLPGPPGKREITQAIKGNEKIK